MTDLNQQRVALAFLESFWEDRDAGEDRGLASYLARFPGHEELIATEYLNALAELRGETGEAGARKEGDEGTLGPYRLIEEIGRGGQGVVWLAEDGRLNNRKVALKVLTGLGPGAEGHLARFKREAALASKLEHPGICGVHDTGIEGGVPYIAMRYVAGETLADRLTTLRSGETMGDGTTFLAFADEEGRPDRGSSASKRPSSATTATSIDRSELDRLVRAFEKIALALHAAHEVGIIHRDVKPGNIMVTPSGEPIVLDFGLARDDSDESGPSLTQTGDLFGTPAYMSPEQIMGQRVRLDRRSDIYSLGATLYECLTMKRPFEAPTREALYQAILSKEAQPARKMNRQIPADLEVVLQCALDKDRDRRYQTAADLAEDLRRVRENEPIMARKVGPVGRGLRWARRRPAAAALVIVLAIGIPTVSALGVWFWLHRDDVAMQLMAQREAQLEDLLERGFFELHQGDRNKAVPIFEQALELAPSSVEALAGLARTHLVLDDKERALETIVRGERSLAVTARTDRGALARVKAEILEKSGRKAEAAAVLESAPSSEGPLMWFLAANQKLVEADRLHHDDDRQDALLLEAAELAGRAVTASPRVRRAYVLMLAAARAHGHDERAVAEVCDAVEALWPDSVEAHCSISYAWFRLDPARAEVEARRAIASSPESARAWGALGNALYHLKRKDELVDVAGKVVALQPESALAHVNLGLALTAVGRLDEALAELREGLRLEPTARTGKSALADCLRKLGRLDEAKTLLREMLADYPENPNALTQLGRILCDSGRMGEGMSYVEKAIELHPRHAYAHYLRGCYLAQQGQLEQAAVSCRRALDLDPETEGAASAFAQILRELGRREEAMTLLREQSLREPEKAIWHLRIAGIHQDDMNLLAALVEHETAARLEPDNFMCYRDQAATLNNLGRYDDAIEIAKKGIALKADEAHFHYCVAYGLAMKGWPVSALPHAEEAARLNAGREPRLDRFLATMKDRLEELEEAIRGLHDTIEREPENHEAINDLAWALVAPDTDPKLRDPKEALPLARRAAELTERKNLPILDTLAVACFCNGEFQEAVSVREEILRLMNGQETDGMTVADAEAALARYRKALDDEKKEEK